PQITAQTAIVMDAQNGLVLYNKSMHQQMYPASLTKIMTGILAVENGSPSDIITISKTVTACESKANANIALALGEQITQQEALYAMFLASANDAALALAEHNGGTVQHFVSLMNSRAAALGALDTHFSNPDGLPDENNVTSAYDLAVITRHALQMPELIKYFSAFSYDLPPTNTHVQDRKFETLQKMMRPDSKYYYSGVIAGKTGWETMSGHTLVTAAKRNGITLICVVLKSSNASTVYTDTISLLDYCYGSSGRLEAAAVKAQPAVSSTAQSTQSEVTPVEKTAALPATDTSGVNFPLVAAGLLIFVAILLFLALVFKKTRS
ncbi:MAG: D-alanyl-D-alanine carboxypeptidase, partial [Clostridia bacterium]|nr:D-alanyl-D-alanine carboxypeptidase [Clostridia bacterium]